MKNNIFRILLIILVMIFLCGCIHTEQKTHVVEHGDLYEVEEWEEQVVAYEEVTNESGAIIKMPKIMVLKKRKTLTRTHDLTKKETMESNTTSPMFNAIASKGLGALTGGTSSLLEKLGGLGGGSGLFGGTGWSEEIMTGGGMLWLLERYMASKRRANPNPPMTPTHLNQSVYRRDDEELKEERK